MALTGIMAARINVPFHQEIEFIKNFDSSSLDSQKIKSIHGKVYERINFENFLEEFLSNTLCDQQTSS